MQFSKLRPRSIFVYAFFTMLMVIFILKSMQFSLVGNLQLLATSMATIGIVAVGQTLVILTGGIDLSVGSVVAFTSVITAYLASGQNDFHLNVWVAAGIGLLLATLIGWLHGFLISRFNLAPFIVTFGSLSLFRGLAQVISGATTINLHTDVLGHLWDTIWIIPIPALIMLATFIIVGYLLSNTRIGRYTYAIGSNETVAHMSGVNVGRVKQIIYAASGFLAGLAGILFLAFIEGGTYTNGQNFELLSIAAVIIGGTSLKGGTGGVWGTLSGVLLMGIVNNSLVLVSIPPLWKETITGAIIVAAALIDMQHRRAPDSARMPLPMPLPLVIEPAHSLEQAINRFTDTIKERFDCGVVRVYLRDRDTGKLLDPMSRIEPSGTLVEEAAKTGKMLTVNDFRREQTYTVIPQQPDARAAAALVLQRDKQIIGVVELQSQTPFSKPTLEAITLLITQIVQPFEDRWLYEGGWLVAQVKECLRNLNEDLYLNRSPLTDWLRLGSGTNRGALMREKLCNAIEQNAPQTAEIGSKASRRYQILKQTYIEQKPVDAIINNLGLSRRQYFYDLKNAIDAVTEHLWSQHIGLI